MSQVVFLETSRWPCGQHYYANLVGYRGKEYYKVELVHTLTTRQARELNKQDGHSFFWEKGMETRRFFYEEDAQKVAIETYKKHYPDAEVLVFGSSCRLEPQLILDGPVKYKEAVNKLSEKADLMVDWTPERGKLCDRWKALNKKHGIKQ